MQTRKRRTLTLLAFTAMLGVIGSGCSSAQAQQNQDSSMTQAQTFPRTISVSGTGTTYVEPNQAVARFEFTEQARDLQSAHQAVQQSIQRFIDAVVDAGWDRELVRQSGISYHPNYDYIQNEGQVFRNFSASVTLSFRTETLSDVPGILDLAVTQGVTQIYPVQYAVTDRASKEGDARRKAIADARMKAEELAQAAGAELGRVVSVSESGAQGPTPRPSMRMVAADSVEERGDFADVSPNQIELLSHVSVTWELR